MSGILIFTVIPEILNVICYAAKAIDRYVVSRREEQADGGVKVDPKLQTVVEGIFRRCIQDGEFKQASYMTYVSYALILTYI